MIIEDVPIGAITVDGRRRRDLGDLNALADSMLSVGLLHPITIDPSRSLLAGVRRLGAARRLGWDTVPCVVVDSVGDLWRALEVERDENTCRKDFTRSEAVEMVPDCVEV